MPRKQMTSEAGRALADAADAYQQGAWANAPRYADPVQERIATAQYTVDWLRARAEAADEQASNEQASPTGPVTR